MSNEGFAPGYTTGNTTTGGATGRSGGSYAGIGGLFPTNAATNTTYGDYALPDDWGSGGGNSFAGGGLAHIQALTVQLNGAILANGGSSAQYYDSANGSGGSILISTATLSGSGMIEAAGGSGYNGGGGGGRVAVYAGDMSGFNPANIAAPGGNGDDGAVGSPGTVYLDNTSANTKTLIVDAAGGPTNAVTPLDISAGGVTALVVRNNAQVNLQPEVTPPSMSLTVTSGASLNVFSATIEGSTTISGGAFVSATNTNWADVTVSGSTLRCNGPQSMASLSIVNNGVVDHPAVTPTATHSLDLNISGTLTIDATSRIDVSGEGYAPGYTTGNTATGGATGRSGGSYAGTGGLFPTNAATNSTYGDYALPDDWGSGGGNSFAGGGLAHIQALTVQLNGAILANGGSSAQYYDSANGSGGSILISTATLSGSGMIEAAGGSGYNGGGGGGRVAVYAGDMSGFNPANIAAPGGSGNAAGGPGTVYLRDFAQPQGTLVIAGAAGPAAADTPLEVMSQDLGNVPQGFLTSSSLGTMSLGGGATVQLEANPTGAKAIYVGSLIVAAGTTLDLNGFNLYARTILNSGSIVGGVVNSVPPGPLVLGEPVPGFIHSDGQIDNWTFLGEAGQAISMIVNTGGLAVSPPPQPYLNFATVSLVDPGGKVLATTTNSQSGADATILGFTLPTVGTYSVQVRAGLSGSQADYTLTAWDATASSFPLSLDQTVTGQLSKSSCCRQVGLRGQRRRRGSVQPGEHSQLVDPV